jgi:ribosomal protein S18 acetylase RimI-like enzyme
MARHDCEDGVGNTDDFSSRPYRNDDLPALLDLVARANVDQTRTPYWNTGDVLWQMYRGPAFDPTANIRLWHADDGALAGFAWREAPGAAIVERHPHWYRNPGLEALMLAWTIDNWAKSGEDGKPPSLTTYALDSDDEQIARLEAQGFAVTGGHLYSRMERDLTAPMPDTVPPSGAIIRPINPESELEERVALHREVWANSAVTPDSYRRMRAVPGYSPDLDIVAVLPDGAFASYCICWFDPVSGRGEFEPVGTRAAYRRQGLGKAVVEGGLHRLRSCGARSALVYCSGMNPAAQALYESAGFAITDRERAYAKVW